MGAAILMGDLLLCWTDEMFHASGLPGEALRHGGRCFDRMRTEVFAGQYLDLLGQVTGDDTLESALRVVEFKTTKYTIERPLHLGAALAGGCAGQAPDRGTAGRYGLPGAGAPHGASATPGLAAAYTAYGLPLGLAFQLRDDILGGVRRPGPDGQARRRRRQGWQAHGTSSAIARDRATATQAGVIDRYLGDPMLDEAGTAEVRDAITATGAVAECERMIGRHVSEAVAALAGAPINRRRRETRGRAGRRRHDPGRLSPDGQPCPTFVIMTVVSLEAQQGHDHEPDRARTAGEKASGRGGAAGPGRGRGGGSELGLAADAGDRATRHPDRAVVIAGDVHPARAAQGRALAYHVRSLGPAGAQQPGREGGVQAGRSPDPRW